MKWFNRTSQGGGHIVPHTYWFGKKRHRIPWGTFLKDPPDSEYSATLLSKFICLWTPMLQMKLFNRTSQGGGGHNVPSVFWFAKKKFLGEVPRGTARFLIFRNSPSRSLKQNFIILLLSGAGILCNPYFDWGRKGHKFLKDGLKGSSRFWIFGNSLK